jgi:hypothetical protein
MCNGIDIIGGPDCGGSSVAFSKTYDFTGKPDHEMMTFAITYYYIDE